MARWKVQSDDSIDKSLRRYKANRPVGDNYAQVVQSLADSDAPETVGVLKKGKYARCFGTHITKSVVLIYRVDYKRHRIDLIELGDHKMVYGKDA